MPTTEKTTTAKQDKKPTEQKATSLLTEINSSFAPIEIKGKNYVPVNQRVLKFREAFPYSKIETEILEDDGERCVFKATISNEDGNVISTGHAYEVRGGMINSTSYLENCETSAVGRALAFLGIGSMEAIASYDEVQNALNSRPPADKEKPIPQDRAFIGKCRSCGKRYTFQEGTTEEQLKATPCCERPDWIVE